MTKLYTLGFVTGIILIILGFVFKPFVTVPAGHRGVVTHFGAVQEEVKGEGFHFVMPIYTKVTDVEVRTQKIETEADSASKDLQSVNTTVALNFHLEPTEVNHIYQDVGTEYRTRIIDPAIQESVKAATAQFTAEELITKRPDVKKAIKQEMADRLRPRNIIIDDFSIVNFSFSQEFDKAIEAKQTAEQQALKAERDLERIKLEAQQKIERAKAEAESLRIQKEELTPQLLQLRWVEKWNGEVPQYWGQASPFIGLK